MHFNAVFVLFFISFLTLAGAHILALNLFLYWTYLWFDIPMHFLGGLVVALGYHSLPAFRIVLPLYLRRFVPTLVAVLIVGLSWEVFEIASGTLTEDEYIVDTIYDLVIDLFGGTAGYMLARTIKQLDV